MTGSIQRRLIERGIELPPLPAPIGNYAPFRIGGDTLYLSGVGPRRHDGGIETGKVGLDVSVEAAYGHARLCGLNMLAIMQEAVGDLDRIAGVLKVFGMVNATPDFQAHPKVIDGCTDLLVEVFGDLGKPARSAVGMGSLPRNISVEIEGVVLIRP
jgi:enamine deaminase RidA (YjgF/YER057c/UK114 family)